MIYIGVDLHQRFCYMTAMDATGAILAQGQVANQAAALEGYFRRWSEPAEVAVEACSFWPAFTHTVGPLVERVVLVHPQRVKAIASAKLKNDRVDSLTLAHLLRANLLPEAWMADKTTRELRQLLRMRVDLGRQRARWKNRVHAVLHQHGLHRPASDLFGQKGRAWLGQQMLPPADRQVVDHCLELVDQLEQMIRRQDAELVRRAQGDPDAQVLTSIPGIGPYSALLLRAEIGDIHRFASKRQLYSYAGLVPRVRDSAERKRRGPITRGGSPLLRWILVEAAHTAARHSPAAQHYFQRLRRGKHPNVAHVALARKLLGAVWALLRHGVCFDEEAFCGGVKEIPASLV